MKDKVVVVTGASSGIGQAAALAFAKEGAAVVGIGRNEKALVDGLKLPQGFEGSTKPLLADLSEPTQLERAVNEVIDHFGRVDVLVNCAGILRGGNIESTTIEEWDKTMNINLRSVFMLTQRLIPHLLESKGNIVNVSSVAGTRAFPNVLAYCVSKAALDQLTRCLALELAPRGVRVNAVNPGVVVTNLHKRGGMSDEDYEAFLENSKNTHPIGRPGEPEEVANLIVYLASEKAGWITGATYAIDGGRAETCAR
jgi:NAD(P)-dependent dehydrogenase (short-subunit alcohol dehydrogenase family)